MPAVGPGSGEAAIPDRVAEAARRPAVAEAIAEALRQNSRSEHALGRTLARDEAHALARRTVATLLDPACLQMADVGGLRFYLVLDSELLPASDAILANAWDGVQWRPVRRIPLGGPGGPAAP